MGDLVDISRYAALFHDGSIIEINHVIDCITLIMNSAEVDPDEIEDKEILSNNDRIEGELHISHIRNIKIDMV